MDTPFVETLLVLPEFSGAPEMTTEILQRTVDCGCQKSKVSRGATFGARPPPPPAFSQGRRKHGNEIPW